MGSKETVMEVTPLCHPENRLPRKDHGTAKQGLGGVGRAGTKEPLSGQRGGDSVKLSLRASGSGKDAEEESRTIHHLRKATQGVKRATSCGSMADK